MFVLDYIHFLCCFVVKAYMLSSTSLTIYALLSIKGDMDYSVFGRIGAVSRSSLFYLTTISVNFVILR